MSFFYLGSSGQNYLSLGLCFFFYHYSNLMVTNNVEVKKEQVKKEEPKVRDDDILCCGGCGCYGMAGEFFSSEACCRYYE